MDQAAEKVAAVRLNRQNGRGDRRRPVGRDKSERTMGPMSVVVAQVDAKDTLEMAATDDQEMVEAIAPDGADPPSAWAFAFGARTGVRITLTPSERKISSKPPLNFESRSWISSRNG